MPPVKRKLDFGEDASDSISGPKFLIDELERIYRDSSEFWNFDFLNEKPLQTCGGWEWTIVEADEEISKAYKEVCNQTCLMAKMNQLSLNEDTGDTPDPIQSQQKLNTKRILNDVLPSLVNLTQSTPSEEPIPDCPRELGKNKMTWMPASMQSTLPVRT